MVASWTGDGTAAAAYGTQLGELVDRMDLHLTRRMVRRAEPGRVRFLPLHLAMEGFLALHFGGPSIAWREWSAQAVRDGLSPREEAAYSGAQVRGLDDALRVFEIHEGQCGLVVYAGDVLAGATVVPHPDDYRALHPSLVRDMYGELIYHSAMHSYPVPDFTARLGSPSTVAGLRAAVARAHAEWDGFHASVMTAGLLEGAHAFRRVRRMGRFTLSRFLPSFERRRDNHIGEVITDHRGAVAYLKTFRLSEAQTRRGHLLTRLEAHDWHLETAAREMDTDAAGLALRIERAGLGHLLRQDVLDGYRRAKAGQAPSRG
ncbi:hypothetical protein ACFFMN_08900 [Planobispora siamensis]|uniref:ARG and Rhodanese-Phosphatase-superfamily-associated domain-containing protein n=1 Tax=Planobispora siamensis TaxID=936338 RepID=A0A8J3WHX3_9ACTN|nr:hypothetical protein [Planobispora siamensis]GIH91099.1 hypothetical protein Psi01_17290 [Planobispora siamensis]